jgi:hypothetical protein
MDSQTSIERCIQAHDARNAPRLARPLWVTELPQPVRGHLETICAKRPPTERFFGEGTLLGLASLVSVRLAPEVARENANGIPEYVPLVTTAMQRASDELVRTLPPSHSVTAEAHFFRLRDSTRRAIRARLQSKDCGVEFEDVIQEYWVWLIPASASMIDLSGLVRGGGVKSGGLKRCILIAGEAMRAVAEKRDELLPVAGGKPSEELWKWVRDNHYAEGQCPAYLTFCRYVRAFNADGANSGPRTRIAQPTRSMIWAADLAKARQD